MRLHPSTAKGRLPPMLATTRVARDRISNTPTALLRTLIFALATAACAPGEIDNTSLPQTGARSTTFATSGTGSPTGTTTAQTSAASGTSGAGTGGSSGVSSTGTTGTSSSTSSSAGSAGASGSTGGAGGAPI